MTIPDPNDPARRKPPELIKVSLSDVKAIRESAETLLSPKPEGEEISEDEFAAELERASAKANPGNETLNAMEK